MVKKIMKYAKFMVCIILMVSLIAPSYAALSASDGSAFVTKAEFDSALADFNARLTTFEAGINSKIDSQVSSYLDRNGIWNGAEQTLDIGTADAQGWTPMQTILNMGVWGESSTTDDDLSRDEWCNLYGLKSLQIEGTWVPPVMTAQVDAQYRDSVCSSILGRLLYNKSHYAKSFHYLHDISTEAKKRSGTVDAYWDIDDVFSTSSSGFERSYNEGDPSQANMGTHLIGKPRKVINEITKSGLMFLKLEMNHITDDNPYYGWQFMGYESMPAWDTAKYAHGGSFPHTVGATPIINVYLDACVGENLADSTTWNGTIMNDTNFKNYSRASYSPVAPQTTLLGGDPMSQVSSLAGSASGASLWHAIDTHPNIVGMNTIKMGMARNMTTLQFFVKKGEQVWLTGNWSYSFGNRGGRYLFYGMSWIIGGSSPLQKSSCSPRWKMSASVY